jgi:hypothetical protein
MMHGHDINQHADEEEQAMVEGDEMSSKVSVIHETIFDNYLWKKLTRIEEFEKRSCRGFSLRD